MRELSVRLTKDFGQGYSENNLKYFRQFYLGFRDTSNSHAARDKSNKQSWGTRALERQINTLSYERILSSKNKLQVKNVADKSDKNAFDSLDLIKDPYVLEFLQLQGNTDFYERDLGNSNHK